MSLAVKHFYRFGDFTVDTGQKILLHQGTPLPLTPKVFDTLLILVEHCGRIVEKEELMSRLWPDSFVEEGNLTFNIKQLRKLLGDDAHQPVFIETVARRGYRFIAPVTTDEPSRSIRAGDAAADVQSPQASALRAVEYEATQAQGPALTKAPVRAGRGTGVPPVSHAQDARATARRWWPAFLVIAVVLIVALGGWLLWSRFSPRPQPSRGKVMLAVLPFQQPDWRRDPGILQRRPHGRDDHPIGNP